MPQRLNILSQMGAYQAVNSVAIVFSYVVLIRPWDMRWGATAEEVNMALPGGPWAHKLGDPLAHNVVSVSTRAITIHAPASRVWQWMVQKGEVS